MKNRTRDLPACTIVPQRTTLPRAPKIKLLEQNIHMIHRMNTDCC
jgi:hypothetical protein